MNVIAQKSRFLAIDLPLNINNVNDLYRDTNGELWIATNKALLKFDVKTKNFSVYLDYDDKEKLKANCITPKRTNGLWLGTYRSSIVDFNYEAGANEFSFESLVGAKELVTDINYIDNETYITTANGHIVEFNTDTKKFRTIYSPVSCEINAIWKEASGKIWLSTVEGVYTLKKGRKWKLSKLFFQSYGLEVKKNEYWVIGRDDEYRAKIMYLYNYESDVLNNIKQRWANLVFNNLPNPYVRFNDLDFDSDGMLWLASNVGVLKYDPYTGYSIWFSHKRYPDFPFDEADQIMVKDNSHIWVSFHNKLYMIDLSVGD